jgi:hypothetical protein
MHPQLLERMQLNWHYTTVSMLRSVGMHCAVGG